MVNFLISAVRVVRRRLADDWLMLGVLTLTIAVAMVQLAAAPIYREAATLGALRQILTDAAPDRSSMSVSLRTSPEMYPVVEAAVGNVTAEVTAGVATTIHQRLESASSFSLPAAGDDNLTDITVLMALPAIQDHATLVDGTWEEVFRSTGPTSSSNPKPVAVALPARAASWLRLSVGDAVPVTARSGRPEDGPPLILELVATYVLDDPDDPFWTGDKLLTESVLTGRSFRSIGPVVVSTETILNSEPVDRLAATWVVEPAADQMTMADLDQLERLTAGLEDRLTAEIATLSAEATAVTSRAEVAGGLPDLLLETGQALRVTRSGVYAVVGQLAILAAMAIGIGAALLVEVRRPETALFHARGTGWIQLIALAMLEAVVLVVPATVAAPPLAVFVVDRLGRVGFLAGSGQSADPWISREAVVTVTVAAAAAMAILAWPALRTGDPAAALNGGRRRRLKQLTERSGVDLALVGMTVIAFWQLRGLGGDRIAPGTDPRAIDPVLVVTPALALLTGAVLTLRIVPLVARLAERLVDRTRSLILALTGWELARRPAGQARSVFLVVMALSLGIFAVTYQTTWEASQFDQATHQAGADIRLLPDRRIGTSITDLHLLTSHENLDEVERSMPVIRRTASLPGDAIGQLLLLDAGRSRSTVQQRVDPDVDFERLMSTLAAARPAVPGVVVPGRPVRLTLAARVDEELVPSPFSGQDDDHDRREGPADEDSTGGSDDGADEGTDNLEPVFLPPAFRASLHVLIQDGNGFLHRLDAGWLEPGTDLQRFTIELSGPEVPNVPELTPAYPLSIVEFELRAPATPVQSRRVAIELLNPIIHVGDGTEAVVVLDPDDPETGDWRGTTAVTARTAGMPTVAVNGTGDGLSVALDTAATGGIGDPVVLFTIRAGTWQLPATIPAVVSSAWLDDSASAIGERLVFDGPALNIGEIEIIGSVPLFPTVDPHSQHAIIMDLATIQLLDHRPGRPLLAADEYWIDVADGSDPSAVAGRLAGPPFNSADVVDRDARFRRFRSDPAAVAMIGAYSVGFMAAAVFAVLVFLATTAVSARERRGEYTLLRAFGVTQRQLVRWTVTERLLVVTAGVVLGTALGYLLSATVLPLVSLGRLGAATVPAVRVRYPWLTIAAIEAAPLGALIAVVVAAALRKDRETLGSRIRRGDQ
ncbi:MAG: ABC transporter permease [Acidimicrobiia bacterium]|nr:ABC transporter permease [Acidimicrobiia bacterium]